MKTTDWSSLPPEIIITILEAAYFDQNYEPDTQLLSCCSSVCRAWTRPSQFLLFRHVVLKSGTAFRSFMSAVSKPSSHSRSLGNAVVRMRVVIDHKHPDQLSHRAMALAVTSCPSLYELDLSFYGCNVVEPTSNPDGPLRVFRAAPSFDNGTLDLLRTGPQIRSLKLANWSDNGEIPFQLLSGVWPSLAFVSLRGNAPCLPVTEEHAVAPFSGSLSDLRLGLQSSATSEFVEWLLAGSRPNLRSLELEEMPNDGVISTVLRQCSGPLESLSLPSCTSREQVATLQECQSLREIKLETSSSSPLLHALHQLPESVEHFAFTLESNTPLYLVIKFIKARRALKFVTIHAWEDGESHKDMPALRIACAWKGVRLVVMRDVQGFRESFVSVFFSPFLRIVDCRQVTFRSSLYEPNFLSASSFTAR
jgi:hypothetical protein